MSELTPEVEAFFAALAGTTDTIQELQGDVTAGQTVAKRHATQIRQLDERLRAIENREWLSRAPMLESRIAVLEAGLKVIAAGGCTNLTGDHRCSEPMYGRTALCDWESERWCDPCIAQAVLDGKELT